MKLLFVDAKFLLQGYQGKRLVRASTIHGLAGSAAIMASTYKAYLGEGLGPLGKLMLPLKIPHPGKVPLCLLLTHGQIDTAYLSRTHEQLSRKDC